MHDTYTLAEAAAKLGVREDTLTAILPDIGVDWSARSPQTLTEEEVKKLTTGFQHLEVLHSEAG